MKAYIILLLYLGKAILIFLGVVFFLALIVGWAILPVYLWRKRKKRATALFFFCGWIIFLIIVNRIMCPTYWKYPDFLIRKMELYNISRIWGKYDFIAPVKEKGYEEYFQVAGYKIGKDEEGVDQYYFIYEHGYQIGDWEYDIWIGKGEKYIDNWYECFTEGEAPRYYELQTYIDLYVKREGEVFYFTGPGLDGDEDKMLSYLGVSRGEFLKMVYEQYPDFGIEPEE
ncbi:MAG: hypothetical protein J6O73_05385 [Lachnospiraceae bacterium]|nr:hypothetical protein [Lachnospiraceae bacterium]